MSIRFTVFILFSIIFCIAIISIFLVPQSKGELFLSPAQQILNENEEILAKGNTLSVDEILDNSRKVLKKGPLYDEALFQFASAQNLTEPQSADGLLYQFILHNNPRNRRNLYALYSQAVFAGDPSAMVEIVDMLYRLNLEQRSNLDVLFSILFNDPAGYQAILEKLPNRPDWAPELLENKIQESNFENISKTVEYFEIWSKFVANHSSAQERLKRLINLICVKLLEFNLDQEAKEVWKNSLPTDYQEADIDFLNFNSDFSIADVAPPFNWSFFKSKNFWVELDVKNGLYLNFNPREPGVLFKKIIDAPVGPFSLEIHTFDIFSANEAILLLKLKCLPSNSDVLVFSLDKNYKDDGMARFHSNGFTKPCGIGEMSLWIDPVPRDKRKSIKITNISIHKIK